MEEVRSPLNPLKEGLMYRGLIYFVFNDKGEKVGDPFKSSLFGKSAGIEALEKRIEKSAEIIKNEGLKERSKKVIATAMRTCKNRQDFEKALEKQGISALFRTNDEGRIYGATFIDHEQKCVFNGSRLGKEFSANVFNELFNNNRLNIDLQDDKTTSKEELESGQSFNQENQDSGFGGIFDLFSPEIHGNNPEEETFLRRMRKKKKQQRKI
jgi:hypothetical protein